MDILNANFPHLALLTGDCQNPMHARARTAATNQGITKLIGSETHASKSENTIRVKEHAQHGAKASRLLIHELKLIRAAILLNHTRQTAHSVFNRLAKLMIKLDQLYDSPSAFVSEEERSNFFSTAMKVISDVGKLNEAWSTFEKGLCAFQDSNDRMSLINPPHAVPRSEHALWDNWCKNQQPFPDLDLIKQASNEDDVLCVRTQFLPRGGVFIVEHWRREVNKVVVPLLELAENDPILKEQRADQRNIYFHGRELGGKIVDRIVTVRAQSVPYYRPQHAFRVSERITSLSSLLARMNDHSWTGLDAYFGMSMTKFLGIVGMRAILRKANWDAEHL